MAKLDVGPTGDQEVAGSIHACSEIDHEIISSYSLPSTDSRRPVVSLWLKNVHKY